MKVIEINATYEYGSTGLIVRDIGRLLEQNGDEVRYIYQFGSCDVINGYRAGSHFDWKFHALYTRITGKQAWASKVSTKQLLNYLNHEKPDVVHLHNLHANYINLPMLLKYLAKQNIATVVTLHDCWFLTGKCCHFAATGCERWKIGCGSCPKRKEKPRSLFCDASHLVAKKKAELFHDINKLTIVGCSKWISNIAKESFVFKGCDVTYIYNGVDTTVFAPKDRTECIRKLGITAKYILLGMAGKWLDERNREVFKTVLSKLSQDEVLVLVGCTDQQKQFLNNYHGVIAVGFVNDRELLSEYYNIADVFVNLTFEDTLPTVNMEALSSGTPVITYDSCGSPELVLEGQTGYIVKQADVLSLIKAIVAIKDKKINRVTCGAEAIRHFDKNINYQQYLRLFRQLVEKE